MSDTIVDMPKVCQMLDAGWRLLVWKDGNYIAVAYHDNRELWERAKQGVLEQTIAANKDQPNGLSLQACVDINNTDFDRPGYIATDDFTPEQALTRLAYKVHGELL